MKTPHTKIHYLNYNPKQTGVYVPGFTEFEYEIILRSYLCVVNDAWDEVVFGKKGPILSSLMNYSIALNNICSSDEECHLILDSRICLLESIRLSEAPFAGYIWSADQKIPFLSSLTKRSALFILKEFESGHFDLKSIVSKLGSSPHIQPPKFKWGWIPEFKESTADHYFKFNE